MPTAVSLDKSFSYFSLVFLKKKREISYCKHNKENRREIEFCVNTTRTVYDKPANIEKEFKIVVDLCKLYFCYDTENQCSTPNSLRSIS